MVPSFFIKILGLFILYSMKIAFYSESVTLNVNLLGRWHFISQTLKFNENSSKFHFELFTHQ